MVNANVITIGYVAMMEDTIPRHIERKTEVRRRNMNIKAIQLKHKMIIAIIDMVFLPSVIKYSSYKK